MIEAKSKKLTPGVIPCIKSRMEAFNRVKDLLCNYYGVCPEQVFEDCYKIDLKSDYAGMSVILTCTTPNNKEYTVLSRIPESELVKE